MEILGNVLQYAGFVILALAGMLAHFFKKKIKGETITEITGYFEDNFKSTAIAVFGVAIGLLIAIQTDTLNWTSAPLIGYTFDSILNSWDKGERKG